MRARGLALLMALSLFAGCKKSESGIVKKTKLQLVSRGPWRETQVEYRRGDGSWVPVALSATAAGYLYAFTATGAYGGTYSVTGGGFLIGTGTWSIIGDDTQLELNNSVTYDFGTLDDGTMQLILSGQIPYTDPSTHATTQYYGQRQTFVH